MKNQNKQSQPNTIEVILSVLVSSLLFTSLLSSENFLSPLGAPKFYPFVFISVLILIFSCIQEGVNNNSLKINVNLPSSALLLYNIYVFFQLLVNGNLSLENHRYFILMLCSMLYFVISKIINDTWKNNKRPIEIIIIGFLCVGLFHSLYAVAQLAGIVPNLMSRYSFGGALGNPNILATYLSTILPFALAIYLFIDNASSKRWLNILSILLLLLVPLWLFSVKAGRHG